MVGINDNNTNSEIINMLNKLFLTTKDTAKSNANILKTRYNINIEKKESENMITFGEGLFNYGMIQGTEEGYKKGFNKGIKDGNKKGRELGIKKGKELGIKEGKELGIKKGKELGIKEGIKTGQIETLAKNVINLSKSLNISNKEAMKLLKISKNNQNEVIKKIKHLSK